MNDLENMCPWTVRSAKEMLLTVDKLVSLKELKKG
jgi:hypothetical protein